MNLARIRHATQHDTSTRAGHRRHLISQIVSPWILRHIIGKDDSREFAAAVLSERQALKNLGFAVSHEAIGLIRPAYCLTTTRTPAEQLLSVLLSLLTAVTQAP